jgi:hypothetical protein
VKGMRSPAAGEIHMLQQKLHKVSWWGYLGHICSKRLLWVASNLLRLWSQGIKGMLDLSLCRTRERNVKNWIHFDTKIKKWSRKHWQSKVCESTLHRRNPIW